MKLNIINDGLVAVPFDENLPFIEVTEEEFVKIQDGKLKLINGVLTDITELIEIQNQIDNLTNKLYLTDYIANKLAEANAEYIVTEDKTKLIELRTKYAKELAEREEWRKEIDSLEEKLKNL